MDVSNKTTLGTVKLVMLQGERGETGHGALVANTVADMVDITQIYVYTGSETGYTFGNWYYWNGSAWVSGGVYNAVAFETDKTVSVEDMAADAEVTGDIVDAISTYEEALKWTLKKSVDSTGELTTNASVATTNVISCNGGGLIQNLAPAKDSNNNILRFFVAEYFDGTFIRRSANLESGKYIEVGNDANEIRICFGRNVSTAIEISQADIDELFNMRFVQKSLSKTEYNNTGFLMRGNIINLGYTSLAECSKPGAYVFTTDNLSSITDAPAVFNAGGLLRVYINGNTVYQELINTDQRFIRYGVSGAWHSTTDFVRVSYTEENGDDDSVAQIAVDIPKNIKSDKIRYKMGHCVNTAVNADVWRLMYLYSVTPTGIETVLTRRGEFECALHLNGRSDFSGGVVHGDEKDQNVAFFGDNVKLNAANTSGFYREFRIVRNSILYDPQDSTTEIAEHGVEYIFNLDGLTINQSIKWLVSEDLTNCYLAMLPILKAFSTYRYDDTNFKIVNNNESGYSYKINQAKSVTEYASSVVSTIKIKNYPSGLSGGDCALITDNNGLDYNKVYFPVCSSGKSQIGELWKAQTVYKIK